MADEEFSIYAKILADTKDFQKSINEAIKSIEKFKNKTNDSTKDVNKKIKLSSKETQSFSKILQSFGGAAGSFGSSIISMASSCGPYVAAIVAAIAVTKKYISSIFDCAEAFHVQERAEKGLEIAAKNSEIITSTQVKLLKEYAGDLQKLTDIGDEQSLQLMTQLVASGRTFDEIKKIMSASVDYAKGTNTDIATAVKALNATYTGMAGTLGKQLKDVRNLTEEELKQGKAIDIVAEKYKGLGEQLASIKVQAQNASGDLKEAWGAITAPTADAFYNLKKGFAEIMQNVIKGVDKLTDRVAYSLPKSKEELKTLIEYASQVAVVNGKEVQLIELQSKEAIEWAIAQLQAKKKRNDEEQVALMLMEAEIARRERLEKAEAEDAVAAQKREEEALERQKQLEEAEKKRLELLKLRKTWNDKTLQQEIDMLREEMQYKLDEVKDSENAEKEKYNIRVEYLNKILELLIKQKEIEKETALEGVTDAKVRGEIEAYYENEIARLRKKNISEIGEYTEKLVEEKSIVKSLGDAWKDYLGNFEYFDEIKKLAEDSIKNIQDSFGDAFVRIGESIATGESQFEDYLSTIREVVAEAVKELGKIEALKTLKEISTGNWVSAIIHGATAIGSFLFSGIFGADFTDTVEELTETIEEAVEEIKSTISSAGFADTLSGYIDDMNTLKDSLSSAKTELKNLQDSIKDMETIKWYDVFTFGITGIVRNIKLANEYKELEDLISNIQKEIDNLANKTLKNLNTAIEETQSNIAVMMNLLAGQTDTTKQLSISFQLNNITEQLYNFIDSISSIGADIGSTLVSSMVDGATKTDFLSDMKDYIGSRLMQLAVYTESFQEALANVGADLAEALVTGGDLSNIRNQLEELFDSASQSASKASALLDEAFGDIEESVDTVTSAMSKFWDSINDLGGDIANELISGLTEGLEQGDFLESMQTYIKKMLIQTVVYTESMKAEIEAIGKAISKGLTEGFSDTSLHEIRRDLSYIFQQANTAVNSIDSLLDNVFSGYAMGTNNATAGLHLVGEAGPELVRFHGGEQVYNAQKTAGMLHGKSGSVFNVTFNNTADTTAYAMMKQLKSYNRELAFNGII